MCLDNVNSTISCFSIIAKKSKSEKKQPKGKDTNRLSSREEQQEKTQ